MKSKLEELKRYNVRRGDLWYNTEGNAVMYLDARKVILELEAELAEVKARYQGSVG